jgi:L-2-hydroxyglutarate oxidase
MSNSSRAPYDLTIIGGGIVGLATAMTIARRYSVRLVVVEAEQRIAEHQTAHNSGVIHAGLYYRPGTLRARNCCVGREALYRFCQEHDIPHERCGKLVVATDERELARLDELEQRGHANGLDEIRRVRGEELRDYEPHVVGVAGLWVPYTGIIDFRRVAEEYADLARQAGAEIRTDHRFVGLRRDGSELVLETTRGELRSRNLIACCGLEADRVARQCGVEPRLAIVPFRGEYYKLVPERRSLVRNLIYPVPDPRLPFLGVHFTRMIDGSVEAGPNAVLALSRTGYSWRRFSPRDVVSMAGYLGFWRLCARFWRTGVGEIHRSLSKRAFVAALARLVPELTEEDVVPAGAGVRAQAVGRDGRLVDDFCIVEADRMIHVLNAPSPAATASLAIGEHLAELAAWRFELGVGGRGSGVREDDC